LESETGTENGPLYRAQSSVQLDDEDVVDGCRFLPKFAFEVFCFGFVALAEKTQKAFNLDCVCVCLNVPWDLGHYYFLKKYFKFQKMLNECLINQICYSE